MKFSTRQERRANRLKRPWWKKLLIAVLTPLLTIGIWYSSSLVTYYFFSSYNLYFLEHNRPLYLILSGLLYSGIIPALFISLWVWWKLLFNEKLHWWRWKPLLLSLLLASPVFFYAYKNAEIAADSGPKFIAHRGVSNHNAAENTLEALRLTSTEKPDYIEVDIYETADSDFVVFHDENLSRMTDNPQKPHELTLAELTAITVTDPENGHIGKIPSLDQILDEAEKLNQKLLLDFKVSPLDSPEMVNNFLNKYQSRLERKGHQVQTSDLGTVQTILHHAPKFDTFLITDRFIEADLPGLAGYCVPLMSLTDELYHQIIGKNLKLYVWTTSETEAISTSEHLDIDAIITSYLTKAKNDVSELKKLRNYSSLYYKQLDSLKIFPMI